MRIKAYYQRFEKAKVSILIIFQLKSRQFIENVCTITKEIVINRGYRIQMKIIDLVWKKA